LEARGWGHEGGGGEKEGVITQSLYAHMNKGNNKKKNGFSDLNVKIPGYELLN
jgi:hypothetical protein